MIEKIALLTDSACDLPKEFIERFCIKVLPLSVIYPDKIYQDRITIEPQEVYDRMPDEIPTTSVPTPHEITSILEEIRNEGFTHVWQCICPAGYRVLMRRYEWRPRV